MEKRRRRAQCVTEEGQEVSSVLASDAVQEQLTQEKAEQAEQPAAPRRRRRVQPPQQITQKIPKVVVPEDTSIPHLPAIEEQKPEGRRYRGTGKKKAEKRSVRPQNGEKAKKALAVCSQMGGRALEIVSGILLLAAMLLGEGIKRLGALIKTLSAWIADRLERRGAQPDEQEVVLEAIRPQEYHGRGAQHAAQMHDAKAQPVLTAAQKQRLISAALLIVAVVSLFNIGSILLRTFRTTRLNAQLSDRYASMGGGAGDAFGVIALVAMTPLITIQSLGLIYKLRARRKPAAEPQPVMEEEILEREPQTEDEDIIEL